MSNLYKKSFGPIQRVIKAKYTDIFGRFHVSSAKQRNTQSIPTEAHIDNEFKREFT
jgi:hypothetical protein